MFRGYLMQGLAARFRSWPLWWLLPALLFGLLHWSPAEFGPNAGWRRCRPRSIGLILADVTARTGDLSLAMGLHFANNVIAVLILATARRSPASASSRSTSIRRTPAAMRRLLLADLASTLAAYAAWLGSGARWRRLHSGGPGSI